MLFTSIANRTRKMVL